MPDPNSAFSIQNLLCDDNADDDRYTRSPSYQSESSASTSPLTPPGTTFKMTFPVYSETKNNNSNDHYSSSSHYYQHQSCCRLTSPPTVKNTTISSSPPSSLYHRHHPYLTPPPHNNYITINSDLICAHYLPTHSYSSVKAKRKRASPTQIMILEHVFEHTAFPSTALREELGEKLGMEPRAVQIWFQNKRQSTKREQWDSNLQSSSSSYHHHHHQQQKI